MRSVIVVLLVVLTLSCKSAERSAAAPARAPAARPTPPPHDEAAVLERSKAFFRAVDDADPDAATAMLAPDFLRVGMARFYPVDMAFSSVRARHERGYPKISGRAFSLEKTRFFGDTAVFTTMSTATLVRAEGVAPVTIEHTETLVWIHRQGDWQLANWQEELAGPDTDRANWNETYRAAGHINLEPNKLLVDTVHGRKPGKALDVGMGQGRNALFLASQGWDTTGIDISDEGIRQAQETAKATGLTLHTENVDLEAWDWGEARWDLIGFIYMGSHPDVAKIRRALKPGGIVVIEFFMADATKGTGISGFKKDELPGMFKDGFKVLRYEEVVDRADWGLNKVPLVRFVAERVE